VPMGISWLHHAEDARDGERAHEAAQGRQLARADSDRSLRVSREGWRRRRGGGWRQRCRGPRRSRAPQNCSSRGTGAKADAELAATPGC
jgi:ribosomal protein L32E